MSKGFVYVLSNPAMPGLLKIGFSTKVPTERALELSSTGVPSAFEVEYYCLVEEPSQIESQVHSALETLRQSQDREFFRVEISKAIEEIERQAMIREHTWYREQSKRPRPSKVACSSCGANYISAQYCPKCRIRLAW